MAFSFLLVLLALCSVRTDAHGFLARRKGAGTALSCGGGEGAEAWLRAFRALKPHEPGSRVGRAYEPRGNSTLLVEGDVSAWNNVRMSWETAVCFAYKTRRTYRVPHVPVESYADARMKFHGDNGTLRRLNLFDYYDEASFRRVVPTLLDSDALPGGGSVVEAEQGPWQRPMEDFGDVTHLVYRQGPRHLATRVFAQYADEPAFVPREEYIALVQSAFRLRAELLCLTVARLLRHGLAPGGYVALHRRRGDTVGLEQYHVNASAAAAHVAPLVRGQTVLVVTDTYEPKFLRALLDVSGAAKVVCWADKQWEGEEKVLAVQIDMLAAVGALHFIGSPSSTVSTGIVRWRTQAGTHRVGDPLHFTKDWDPGYEGWAAPGAVGTYF